MGNTPAEILMLPKGGGAISGMGEKFSPDLQTGTGNFAVPLDLPAGRNGLTPQLTLQYSTGSGNTEFGLGWALSLPGVSRQTSKGLPTYDDAKDVFVLSGSEDLVPVAKGTNWTRYRPRTDAAFACITHWVGRGDDGVDAGNYWEVRTRDGLTSLYGMPGVLPPEVDPATIVGPTDGRRIFSWRLTETRDTYGSRIVYEYENEPGVLGRAYAREKLRPSRIRYVDYQKDGSEQFLVEVRFHYVDRPDPIADCRPGFELRTTKRCDQISVWTGFDDKILLRSWELAYLGDVAVPAGAQPPANGVSMLGWIQVIGHDGDQATPGRIYVSGHDGDQTTQALPPLELGYGDFTLEGRNFIPVTGPDFPASALTGPGFELVDLFGSGLPDLVQLSEGQARYWRNLGQGKFDWVRPMADAPEGLSLGEPGVALLDATGDGTADLVVSREGQAGYFPLTLEGTWARSGFRAWRVAPSVDLTGPEVKLVDLDGDGKTDAVLAGAGLTCFFNGGLDGWSRTRPVGRGAFDRFPDVSFTNPAVRWADMNGDGLQDLLVVHSGAVEYWPSYGYGNFGPRVVMRGGPQLPHRWDPKRLLVGDVDGDGAADLVYVEDGQVTVWLNRGGEGWNDPIVIRGTPSVASGDALRLIDLLGTGVAGVLWSSTRELTGRMYFLDLTGGRKPYLLERIDNHLGAVTTITYAPSTRYRLEDERHLTTKWKTPLPFPVNVVAKVVSEDEISGGRLTTEYRYRHGYWDGVEREFRGFGRTDHVDAEVFQASGDGALPPRHYSPPMETRTWFHLGPIEGGDGKFFELDYASEYWAGDPPDPNAAGVLARSWRKDLPWRAQRDGLRALRSTIVRSEVYAQDGAPQGGRPYTVTEQWQDVRVSGVDIHDVQRVFFPFSVGSRATQWERGAEPLHRYSFVGDYDDYGNARLQLALGVPRGRDPTTDTDSSEPYLATTSRSSYAQRDETDIYIVDRVAIATSHEIKHDRGLTGKTAWRIWQDVQATPISPTDEIIGQTVNHFDGEAYEGLPVGQLGIHGALTRAEALVLTDALADAAYPDGVPALLTGGPLSPDHPATWAAATPKLAGYTRVDGADEQESGWWADTSRAQHDDRGLVVGMEDALKHRTIISYEAARLLPESVTNAVGLVTSATYDYRTLKLATLIDSNGNVTQVTYTPLGLVEKLIRQGKAGEDVGDTLDEPGTRFEYVLDQKPAYVHTTRRVWHALDPTPPQDERDDVLEARAFSDGFGRVLQTRTLAEDVRFGDDVFGEGVVPATQGTPNTNALVTGRVRAPGAPPNVIVSGWQVYDNKGRVVEKYEPFFGVDWGYAEPGEAEKGAKIEMFYDAPGRLVRTVNPDGSEALVVYGVPKVLEYPDDFTPTPWESFAYDPNDNADRTPEVPDAANVPASHLNTPTSQEVDALGRVVRKIERTDHELHTKTSYDIRGNVVDLVDPLGRTAFHYVYDLANRVLRRESIDAGWRTVVLGAVGTELERRDQKGALDLRAYDEILRPLAMWARDATTDSVTQRERIEYGDQAMSWDDARALNLLGRPWHAWDEAGLVTIAKHDFKGNALERSRRAVSDATLLAVYAAGGPSNVYKAWRADWEAPSAASVLDARTLTTTLAYDGLDRVVAETPDSQGTARTLRPKYNRAGALEQVELDGRVMVEQVSYDAKGQRTLEVLGNGVMMRWAYDEKTFRLRRMRAQRCTGAGPWSWQPGTDVFRDTAYDHDLVGNITATHEISPGSGIGGTDGLERTFTYDPLYRLTSATGRECASQPLSYWDPAPRCTDPTQTRFYQENYRFDDAGNLTLLQHSAGSQTNRWLDPRADSNRLATMTMGTDTPVPYEYDDSGNLLSEGTSRLCEWDHADQMKSFRLQPPGGQVSTHAQYLYGADGMRVKKLVRQQTSDWSSTTYDGSFEVHARGVGTPTPRSGNDELHVAGAGGGRVASVCIGTPFEGDPRSEDTQQTIFVVSDHLGSVSVSLLSDGGWTNLEEYTPWGETSFGGYSLKRYRFNGKERDDESGFAYYGLRYYAPWLGRWTVADPLGSIDGLNLFGYVRGNPIRLRDAIGARGLPEGVGRREGRRLHRPERELHGASTPIDDDRSANVEHVGDDHGDPHLTHLISDLNTRFPGNLRLPDTITRIKNFSPPGWGDRGVLGIAGDSAAVACGKLARKGVEETLGPGDSITEHGVSLWERAVPGKGRIQLNPEARKVALEMIVKTINRGHAVFAGVQIPDEIDNAHVDADQQPVVDHFVAIFGYETNAKGDVTALFARDNAAGTRDPEVLKAIPSRVVPTIVFHVTRSDISKLAGEPADRGALLRSEYQLATIRFVASVPYTGKVGAINKDGKADVY